MTDVWYPGRPPLRSPEIVQGLTHYVERLRICSHQCAGEHLETAERICTHVIDILQGESDDCLGSDTDINALLKLLPQTFEAAILCVRNVQWDEIEDIADSVDAIRWALIHQLDALTVGGLDGSRNENSAPDVPRRPAPWACGAENAEQERFAQRTTFGESDAEEALPSGDEDKDEGLVTETGTLSPALETSPQPLPSSDPAEHDPHTA